MATTDSALVLPGQLDGDPAAEGVAQHVHAVQATGIQVGDDGRGEGLDRGSGSEGRGAAVPGEVEGEDVEVFPQDRQQAGEVVAGGADAVQQQQWFAGTDTVGAEQGDCHVPLMPDVRATEPNQIGGRGHSHP